MRRWLRAFTPSALVLVIAGCGGGGGDGAIDQTSLRECMAENGIQVRSGAATTGFVPGAATPDFRASSGSERMDVIVEGSEEKAQRRAADLRSALGTYGVTDPSRRLLARNNVIVVFERDPSPAATKAVNGCLG
jgi:hypothetical protein